MFGGVAHGAGRRAYPDALLCSSYRVARSSSRRRVNGSALSASPLREASVKLLRDAIPATSLKAGFQYGPAERSRAEEIADNFRRHCCADGGTTHAGGRKIR